MLKKILYLFLILCFVSCLNDEDDYIVLPEKKGQSVLIYMASNNNLISYSESNIQELIDYYKSEDILNGNLVVYQRGIGDKPQLLKINSNQQAEVYKTYEAHNSADVNVVREIIDDFKEMFPAETYGCIFWSHATAWLPESFTGRAKSTYSQKSLLLEDSSADDDIKRHPLYDKIRQIDWNPKTKVFGQDGSDWMDVDDLASIIDNDEFEFIMFDACYMSSIEVAYEFKDKASWLLAAPTEIFAEGSDYKTMANNLFSDKPTKERLVDIATDLCEKYTESTISLINLNKIDAFAAEYKSIMSNVPDLVGDIKPYTIKNYDRFSDPVLFDISDYILNIAPQYSSRVNEMLADLVEYKYTTPRFLGLDMTDVSGISTYIPFEDYINVTPFYKELSWWQDVLMKP